ncbi:MAG: hypothetical protein JXA90_11785, partial [Planctomycetes bacterium]|nr:hypothetical protein [Planctomycetota bacterium]
LAALAFLGAGHAPHLEGPYRRHVHKALDYLRRAQDGAGAFGIQAGNYMYNHALATFALSEAFALSRLPEYRECVEAAIRYSESTQQGGGGWDYTAESTGRNDLSITGWQIMAFRSIENAGIEPPARMMRGCREFIERAFTADGYGIYADAGMEAGRRGINMVAVGLLSHLYLGGLGERRACQLAAERILRDPPRWDRTSRWDETYHSYYYWYAGTLGLFHLGGKRWDAWNHFLQQALLPLQSRRVHEDGSWPPESSWIGQSGGRVYATAINVLTLEVYYRYEPLAGTRR